MEADPAAVLHGHGLRVTKPRLAVLAALTIFPHATAETVLGRVRENLQVSTQAIYDVLNTLTSHGLVRRIQPAGSPARYELRIGDNHHHLVCRQCGTVTDIDCATGPAPCLATEPLHRLAPGFVVDEAEVTFWGLCRSCSASQAAATSQTPVTSQTGPSSRISSSTTMNHQKEENVAL